VAIAGTALAFIAPAVLHVLKPEVHPSRSMISQYALGRYGWMMALCFAAFGAASAGLFTALMPNALSFLGRIGQAFLLGAAVGLAMAARFPMDPASTPREQLSFSGRMHGVAFLMGVPSQTLAVLLLSLSLGAWPSQASLPLLSLAAVTWLSLAIMIGIMLKGSVRGLLFCDVVQVAVASQIDVAIHQRSGGIEPVVERVLCQHVEGGAVPNHERRSITAREIDAVPRCDG
jgi:MFS family permease